MNNGEEKAGSGVAMLIRRGVCEKEQVIFDGIRKSMAIKIGKYEENIIIYNIHAPNEEKEKVAFKKNMNDKNMA